MNSKMILEIAKSIVEICNKTTPGNVSHNIATIKHQALYLENMCDEHLATETDVNQNIVNP